MNPRNLRILFDSLNGAARRVLRREFDDAIQRGLFVNSGVRNADELLLALRVGRLNPVEMGRVVKIMMNDGTDSLRKSISESLVQNPSIQNTYKGQTEKVIRERLKNSGFTDESVESFIESWKGAGLKFGTLSQRAVEILKNISKSALYKNSPENIKKGFRRGLETKGVQNLYFNAVKLPFSTVRDLAGLRFRTLFKRLTNQESQRLFTWLLSGIDSTPKDIINILKKEGLLSLGAQTISSGLKRWLIVSLFLSLVSGLYETILEYRGLDEKEHIDDRNIFVILGENIYENRISAKFKHIFPVGFFWNYVWPSINIPLSDLFSGRGFSKTLDSLKHEFTIVDDDRIPESLEKQAGDLLSDISSDGYGNYFLGYERLPIKSYQRTWVVQIDGQWYKLSDVQK